MWLVPTALDSTTPDSELYIGRDRYFYLTLGSLLLSRVLVHPGSLILINYIIT